MVSWFFFNQSKYLKYKEPKRQYTRTSLRTKQEHWGYLMGKRHLGM